MTKNEKAVVIAARCTAYFSGFGGLEIKSIEYGIEDYVLYVTGAWNGQGKAHKSKIYYEERPYFKYKGVRIHLDECIRNGI